MDQKLQITGFLLCAAVIGYILLPSLKSHPSQRLNKYTTGLINTGNDCYANSTFQALASLDNLVEWLVQQLRSEPGEVPSQVDGEAPQDLLLWTSALETMLSELRAERAHSRTRSIWPLLRVMEAKLRSRLSRSQQDAHEMLVYAIDLLETEMNTMKRVCNDTEAATGEVAIQDHKESAPLPFSMEITDTIRCLRCGHTVSRIHESLVLERQPTESITGVQRERIDGYRCEGCQQISQIEKSSRVSRWPSVLAVHINRSTAFGGQSFRNNGETEIPIKLGQFVLKAVVFHKGVHSQGHYTCARRKRSVSRRNSQKWWLISDDKITEVSNAQIRSRTKDAYLLFFELDRIAASRTAAALASLQESESLQDRATMHVTEMGYELNKIHEKGISHDRYATHDDALRERNTTPETDLTTNVEKSPKSR